MSIILFFGINFCFLIKFHNVYVFQQGVFMRVALYTRVSTEEQSHNGLSLAEQMESLRIYAKTEGHAVIGEYTDPGISARKRYTRRPGLLRLLDDARQKKFDMVLFTKLDRWVRSVRDYYQVQDVLDAAGVTWKATQEDYETVTASGRFKVNIMLSVAQDEADRTSERIKFVFDGKRARGERTNDRAPIGLTVVNSKIAPDENIEVARAMFQTYISYRSVNAARRWLAQQGFPRTYNSVRKALANPAYQEYVENWELVQQILKVRGQRNANKVPDRTYLFSGLLRCAECGRNMNSYAVVKAGKHYRYYRCVTHALDPDKCPHQKRVREGTLEEWLLNHLDKLALDSNLKIEKGKPRVVNTNAIRRKMEKLKDLYLSDLIDRDTYARDYEALKAELESIPMESKPIDLKMIREGKAVYGKLDETGRKEFWGRIIQRIDADNNGSFFVAFRGL